jgi:nucleotide-binding universal stress UspA family protein
MDHQPERDAATDRQAATSLVVGFDPDDAGRAALRFAADLGARLQARLHVVHVAHLGDFHTSPDDPGWQEHGAHTLAAERASVHDALGGYPCGWSYETAHGDPASALAAAAEEHDALLVVVGRHHGGMTEFAHRLVAGSVSRRLLDRTRRPVLLVPPP